jgi:hypothetical protein
LIRPSHWTTTSGTKRTAKGSSAVGRLMWNHSTGSTIHLRAVDMVVRTSMGAISAREMVVTSMAISTMEDSRETISTAITMVITMGTMDSTATTQKLRRISHRSLASSAKRLDIMPIAAQRTSPLSFLSPIHFRKER